MEDAFRQTLYATDTTTAQMEAMNRRRYVGSVLSGDSSLVRVASTQGEEFASILTMCATATRIVRMEAMRAQQIRESGTSVPSSHQVSRLVRF